MGVEDQETELLLRADFIPVIKKHLDAMISELLGEKAGNGDMEVKLKNLDRLKIVMIIREQMSDLVSNIFDQLIKERESTMERNLAMSLRGMTLVSKETGESLGEISSLTVYMEEKIFRIKIETDSSSIMTTTSELLEKFQLQD